jgi:hypothetical protein
MGINIGVNQEVFHSQSSLSILRSEWLQESEDPITSDLLYVYDLEIRELYFHIFYSLMGPPELQNTDGDPLSFHRLYYEIESPEQAFERLKMLSVIENADELRGEADLDESGRILRVEIPWTRKNSSKKAKLDNTVLGRLAIDENRLAVEVNSARRAKIIRTEIEKRLANSNFLMMNKPAAGSFLVIN